VTRSLLRSVAGIPHQEGITDFAAFKVLVTLLAAMSTWWNSDGYGIPLGVEDIH